MEYDKGQKGAKKNKKTNCIKMTTARLDLATFSVLD